MNKRIHFVGIGGIGMSGIASILLKKGYSVSGSDITLSPITEKLKREGARVFQGHSAGNLGDTDIVVYSSAVRKDNPEVIEALRRNIEIYSRAKMLAEIMKGQRIITVTGAHGKTTTASLASHLLHRSGLSPTVAIGGILGNIKDNASYGDGSFFVAEADESDGSLLHYSPTYSLITNLDFEHMDFYRSEDNLFSVFKEFVEKTEESGMVFACGDDENLKKIVTSGPRKYMLFGLGQGLDIYARDIELKGFSTEFSCYINKTSLGRFSLPLAGVHNISNALASIGLGYRIGIDADTIRDAISSFEGIDRRFQIRARIDSEHIVVVEDYGHHPTEIRLTLEAARSCGYDRIICAFQPHRYTRTRLLMNEFTRCFDAADLLILTDIYKADEDPIEGIDGEALYSNVKRHFKKTIEFLPKKEIPSRLESILKPGDFVLILGAGDITDACDKLVQRIRGKVKT